MRAMTSDIFDSLTASAVFANHSTWVFWQQMSTKSKNVSRTVFGTVPGEGVRCVVRIGTTPARAIWTLSEKGADDCS